MSWSAAVLLNFTRKALPLNMGVLIFSGYPESPSCLSLYEFLDTRENGYPAILVQLDLYR